MRFVSLLPLLAVFTLCSCFGPQVKEELKREVDAAFLTKKDATYPDGAFIPWAVGQWVKSVSSDASGKRSLQETRITGQEDGALWVESETVSYTGRARSAILVHVGDPADPKTFRVRKMKTQDEDGNQQVFDESQPGFAMVSVSMSSILSTIQQRKDSPTTEDITVPAGTFTGTHRTPVTYSLPMGSSSGTVWYTNAVPLLGFARSQTSTQVMFSSASITQEVLDFGLTGAKTFFP